MGNHSEILLQGITLRKW